MYQRETTGLQDDVFRKTGSSIVSKYYVNTGRQGTLGSAGSQPATRQHPARDPMGGGRGECTGARARHDLWGARRVGLLPLALALLLSTFRRHRLCIQTVATIVGHSRVTAAANSLGDDVVGSLHPPSASVAARDDGNLGKEGEAALEAINAQQRYPPAHIELQKGIDLYVRIFYLYWYTSMPRFVEIVSLRPSDLKPYQYHVSHLL